MGQIVKGPFQAKKLGYKRVRKRCQPDDPDQLSLFPATSAKAQILSFSSGLSSFEQALVRDESGDVKGAAELYTAAIEEQERRLVLTATWALREGIFTDGTTPAPEAPTASSSPRPPSPKPPRRRSKPKARRPRR